MKVSRPAICTMVFSFVAFMKLALSSSLMTRPWLLHLAKALRGEGEEPRGWVTRPIVATEFPPGLKYCRNRPFTIMM